MNIIHLMSVTFLSLLPIINPVGTSSIFLNMTRHLTDEERHTAAYMVAVYCFILLLSVLFLGRAVLEFFGLTLPYIRIAGGLIVSFTAWEMLNEKSRLTKEEKAELRINKTDDLAFFPLAFPITAGAGSIAVVLSIALNIPDSPIEQAVELYSGAVLGILGNVLLVAACYRFCDYVFLKIGKTGTVVITRLLAFILLAIGISIMWSGIKPLITCVK